MSTIHPLPHPYHLRGRRLLRAVTGLLALLVAVAAAPALAQDAPAALDDIPGQIAEVRGLPLLRPIPIVALDRDAYGQRVARAANSDRAARESRIDQILLETLGLLPEGFDLRALRTSSAREGVAGFYNPGDRTAYVVSGPTSTGGFGKLVVAHELTHGLQDQHFDLRRLRPREGGNGDSRLAATAVAEGDATLTMIHWGQQHLTPAELSSMRESRAGAPGGDSSAARPPLVFREQIGFPYREGFAFARRLHEDGGYEAINRALREPPRSTEQVIHPEKYLAGERPLPVELPALAGAVGEGWRLLRADVLGELTLRILIEESLGRPEADLAAAGWGGDAYAVLEDDAGRRLVVVETAWDTEPDAAEFYNAFPRVLARRFDTALQEITNQQSVARWSAPGLFVQLLKSGTVVRLTFAPDAPTLDAVEAQFNGGQ